MSSSERITSVIVDTNAFIIANSDFLGIKSSLLPSFFAVIKEKEIKLLGHPILEKEIEKHIEDSSLYKDYQNLKSNLNKCDEILKLIGCKDDKFITQIFDNFNYVKKDVINDEISGNVIEEDEIKDYLVEEDSGVYVLRLK